MNEASSELERFLEALQGLEGLNAEDIAGLKRAARGEEPPGLPAGWLAEEEPGGAAADKRSDQTLVSGLMRGGGDDELRDIRAKLPNMSIPEKIKLALFGSMLCRALLIMDPSRVVQGAVLHSPRIREGELEAFAKNPNVSDLVLRELSASRRWMKSYSLKLALVTNPKTPGDIALKWLHFLVKADLRKIAVSKNLSQLVTVNARKLVSDMQKKGTG